MKTVFVSAILTMFFAVYTNIIAQIPDDLPPEALEDLEGAADLMGENGPQVGEIAPDFTLQSLDGLEITLSNLKDKVPVVLIFGSCTWPPFRSQVENLEILYQRYRNRSEWYIIYIREAHPSDGWQVDANVKEGIIVEQPDTMEERISIAQEFADNTEISIPVLIDGIDNTTAAAYKAWPDRLYVVGKDGKIVFAGDQGPWGFTPMDVLPEVFDAISGVDPNHGLSVTWGALKIRRN